MEKLTWKDGKPQANRTSVSICLFILPPKHPTALLKESHPALRSSQPTVVVEGSKTKTAAGG